jgi:3-dehydroquinate synthase
MEVSRLDLEGHITSVTLTPVSQCLDWGDSGFDLIIVDSNTLRLLPDRTDVPVLVVPAGEACKELPVLETLLGEFARLELRRDSVVAALGGGAVTDLAAFAASSYLRGLDVVLIPSSLLAMVDAAIGGKTGIDFHGYKNIIGTFHPAREVRLVPELLTTLSEREFLSGLAEVIKAAVLCEPDLFLLLEERSEAILSRDTVVMEEVIRRAVMVKCGIVSRDFREQGERATLNLGHTFGHALEACLGLGRWTHGEAVAWGIARAAETALTLEIADAGWAARIFALLGRYRYPIQEFPVSSECLLAAMDRDKKRRREGVGFILPAGPFKTVQQVVERSIIGKIVNGNQEAL